MARIRLPESTNSLHSTYKIHIPPLLQPRLTWRYTLASAALLYFSYCIVTWQPFFSHNLPSHTGPHGVGTVDIEVPVRQPRLVHDAVFKKSGGPAFELQTVLFTLYYPAVRVVVSRQPRHYWVPKPLRLTAVGYAKFAGVSNWVVDKVFTGVMGVLVGGTRIAAEVDVPIVGVEDFTEQAGRSFVDLDALEKDGVVTRVESADGDGLPIIVFSHGMASSRTQYSHYLGELASRGYICAAIEHRDGSGPGTQVIDSSSKDGKAIDRFHFGLRDVKAAPESGNPKLDEVEFKKAQLAFREAEILETTHIVQSLNEPGAGKKVLAANSRLEGRGAGLEDFWTDRLNINNTILAGHSYGATGAMQALKPGSPFAGGIALDPGKSSGRLNGDIDVPLLIVHSTSWSAKHSLFYGRPHFDTVRDIAKDLNKGGVPSWFMTSLGTSHPSVTDAPLIEPLLLKWTTGAGIDAKEGVRQYMHVSDDFGKFVTTGQKQNLLALPANSPAYNKKNEGMVKKWRTYWQIHVSPVE